MTTPLAIEVTLPVTEGSFSSTSWGDPIPVVKVEHRAIVGSRGLIVSVTAFTKHHACKTWVHPDYFVADGLDSSEPPGWVPAAPEWFWQAVREMEAGQ